MTVGDLPRAIDFYTSTLGFECVFTNGNPICFALLKKDSIEISLSTDRFGGVPGKNNCYIKLKGINSVYSDYTSKNVKVLHPLRTEEYGMHEFMIEDLDGNTINFGEPVS